MHAGPRSVVAKALRLGYYWPTMHADAKKLIRECNDCQGIDIAGPFSEGPSKVKFLIVAIDYFTKFSLPGEIIFDNEKQFRDNPFKDWCKKLCIRQCFASVKHLQSNGLVERANRSLGEGIKARTAEVDMIKNDEALEINLDLLEEKREAAIKEGKSKAKMEKYNNARVRNISFRRGDLVYQNNEAIHAEEGGKIGPKWEGPYEVTEALGKGAYKLRDRKGNVLPRTWNVRNLKKCNVHEM
ncbi:reverse transcriptase domain-containing protein [Tanacetum coccineum]